jgi:UDP-N-acetylglucosamine--N-acetylmuramyl-(pentapeptide) pyrophosphoryl-undecaprenol N-acetylglucosamine transferase
MVFVTVGTSSIRFDRLLDAVAKVFDLQRLVVQHGPGAPIAMAASNVPFMPFPQVLEHMRDADIVVCHGGAGSILAALATGKRPVVMPRRQQHGEAVDDHQTELAHKLASNGVVSLAETADDLAATVSAPSASWVGQHDDSLPRDIRRLIRSAVEQRRHP